ncbi:MAG: LacI family DNA-binding transcriptional regulator [Kiritimatiellae bacterium]|nr:LacI family DNA-binding transcriptional regulator [Kiritimatiellia bacterium]
MTATQKQIAARLGVSRSLVSRALSGTAASIRANPATVARIRAAAGRLDYRPRAAALALRGAATRTLGVLVKDFGDPFFGQMLAELDRLARRTGFSLLMSGRAGGRDESGDLALLARYRPDGLLLVGSDFMPAAARQYASAGQPVVRLGSGPAVSGVAQVSMDEQAGMERLLDHLLDLGHRRVGYLAQPGARSQRRERALRAAAARRGLEAPVTVPAAAWQDDAWTRSLTGARTPRAWVAFDDLTAIEVMRRCRDAGIGVPAEVSLAGVDDIPAAALVAPALTTLGQPVHALARRAFEMALTPGGVREVRIAPELKARESCAHPRPGNVGEGHT